MKWTCYILAMAMMVCLPSCNDPVTFRKPLAADLMKFKVVPVEAISGSFLGDECAIFLNVDRRALSDVPDEMVLVTPEGTAVLGFLHAQERDVLILSIPFRGDDGVASRKMASVPKRFIREFRMR